MVEPGNGGGICRAWTSRFISDPGVCIGFAWLDGRALPIPIRAFVVFVVKDAVRMYRKRPARFVAEMDLDRIAYYRAELRPEYSHPGRLRQRFRIARVRITDISIFRIS